MRKIIEETKAYIIEIKAKDDKNSSEFRVMLEHSNGEREVSYQHWTTRAEAEKAILAYAKDRGSEIQRLQ